MNAIDFLICIDPVVCFVIKDCCSIPYQTEELESYWKQVICYALHPTQQLTAANSVRY